MAGIGKREVKIDFLLEKGMEILWAKGYNGTSVNDIVKAAEVPKGSFYFYFKSKEDFVVQALDRYFKATIDPALKILKASGKSPKTRLLEFYTYRIKVLKEELECQRGCMACNLGSEIAEHNDIIRNKIMTIHQFVNQEITKVAEEAQAAGEIASEVDVKGLVEFIEDAGKGAMISMKELKSPYPIDNVMNMVKTILLK